MSGPLLHSLDITNFRSIRGTIHAPLDAKVVLVHGENGAGKTSLLSAIELALTGRVISLERADPGYARQLLQRETMSGRVGLQTTGLAANNFETLLKPAGISTSAMLPVGAASFFSERCYLPQALLGQLLQIYQDSDSLPDSPLARFVTELLGLDRLDAIETGLGPVADLRNLRRTTDRYGQVESEKQRFDRLIADHQQAYGAAQRALNVALAAINIAWKAVGLGGDIGEDDIAGLIERLGVSPEDSAIASFVDQKRQLASIQRGVVQDSGNAATEGGLSDVHRSAAERLTDWINEHQAALTRLGERVALLLPSLVSPLSDPKAWFDEASGQLTEALRQTRERTVRTSADAARRISLHAELEVERKNLTTLGSEIALLGEDAGSLAEALSELSAFLATDICPVCDRDFSDLNQGQLVDHVHHKVGRLTGSAERLLSLGRNRSVQQEQVDRLMREVAGLVAREMTPQAAAELERRTGELEAVVAELARLAGPIAARITLAADETATRRALSDHQARSLSRSSVAATLVAMADGLGLPPADPLKPLAEVMAELDAAIDQRLAALKVQDEARRKIADACTQAEMHLGRRRDADVLLARDRELKRLHDAALKRATRIRIDGQTIKGAVETVRAHIIGREFNDRLNRLWRDLFVRLAPTEPFVPAFQIPTQATQKLKPKLVTLHRSGGAGGTPGAMLSAGNLNTAALTLFIALHLTVAPQLPWLILDDPVQSMDDVHIAHFAALLRTLSKEHGRQVIVAVHDRQLFEYLRLELSPAYEEDSLLTLELTRSATRDSDVLPKRFRHKKETVLRFAA
jgi:DNA repair protein SbcC/Rad50